MSKNSAAQVVRDPAMSTPEFYNYLIQTIKQTATLQPVEQCKVVRSVIFTFGEAGAGVARATALNALTVPFAVKSVRYSIVAKCSQHNANVKHLYLMSCSLTDDNIGSISGVVGDITEQTHEFIYPTSRVFSNEYLTAQLLGCTDAANSPLIPTNFVGVITLILELSNY
jgi:hypothetical protein